MKLVQCDECARTVPAEPLYGSAPQGWTEILHQPDNHHLCSAICVTAFVNRPVRPPITAVEMETAR